MRAGRLSESPGRAARRSVRVRGETGGADEAEEASGTTTPCTAMTAGPSAPASAAPPFPLLRLLTLHCTRRRGAAEGEGAQQTEKGAADGKRRSGRPGAVPRGSGGLPGAKGSA